PGEALRRLGHRAAVLHDHHAKRLVQIDSDLIAPGQGLNSPRVTSSEDIFVVKQLFVLPGVGPKPAPGKSVAVHLSATQLAVASITCFTMAAFRPKTYPHMIFSSVYRCDETPSQSVQST